MRLARVRCMRVVLHAAVYGVPVHAPAALRGWEREGGREAGHVHTPHTRRPGRGQRGRVPVRPRRGRGRGRGASAHIVRGGRGRGRGGTVRMDSVHSAVGWPSPAHA